MFKSVEYAGFEGKPELKSKAESATDVLGRVIRSSWRGDVEASWRPAQDSRGLLELSLVLTLPDAAASATGFVTQRAFAPGEESLLRIDLRDIWLDLLDSLIAQVAARTDSSLADPVEA